MGATNCCRKPDGVIVEEIKSSAEEAKINDNDKIDALDKDSYPEDTEQVGYNPNEDDQEKEKMNEEVNQRLYEKDGVSPNIGGAYEVPINESNHQYNYEQEIGEHEEAEGEVKGEEEQEVEQEVEQEAEQEVEQEVEQEAEHLRA